MQDEVYIFTRLRRVSDPRNDNAIARYDGKTFSIVEGRFEHISLRRDGKFLHQEVGIKLYDHVLHLNNLT